MDEGGLHVDGGQRMPRLHLVQLVDTVGMRYVIRVFAYAMSAGTYRFPRQVEQLHHPGGGL